MGAKLYDVFLLVGILFVKKVFLINLVFLLYFFGKKYFFNHRNWLNTLEWVLENKNHGDSLVSYIIHTIHTLLLGVDG